nr:hypothetical protein [Bacteroidota bacterium]
MDEIEEIEYRNNDRIHRSDDGRKLADGDVVYRMTPFGDVHFGIAFEQHGKIRVFNEDGYSGIGAGWGWTIIDNVYNYTIKDKINRNWQDYGIGEFTEIVVEVNGKRDFLKCRKIPNFISRIERMEF